MLSYRYLPGHMKQCFAYCSIFPKDYKDSKRNLIHLWMAEGLLHKSRNEKTIEEVGEEYFNELSSRFFLQFDNTSSSFTMHDLMNDLAQHVGGQFFHKMEPNDHQSRKKVRHLSYLLEEFNGLGEFESILELSLLRTFLPFKRGGPSLPIDSFLKLLLDKARRLRVLSLSNYDLRRLPKSIKHLAHLRYLDLSHTGIEELTNSVNCLYNLQTLLMSHCKSLKKLPEDLIELTRLRHLDISGSDKLQEMPSRFGELKLLQLLTTFVVSKTGSKISQLGALSNLHGALSIVNLQEVDGHQDATDSNMKDKKFLDELELKWTDGGVCGLSAQQNVLDKLQPHPNLGSLKIENYGGMRFPLWLESSSFRSMISVRLVSCKNCFSLPTLGQLPCLKRLHIENMINVKVLNSTFFGDAGRRFICLESLTFKNMPEWKQWELDPDRDFPSLQNLTLMRCPQFHGSQPKVPALQKLELSDCSCLVGLPLEIMHNYGSLSIFKCELLLEQWQSDTERYSRDISRLGSVHIDGRKVK